MVQDLKHSYFYTYCYGLYVVIMIKSDSKIIFNKIELSTEYSMVTVVTLQDAGL